MKIGTRVTLRGPNMWAFLDRLIHLAIATHQGLPWSVAKRL